MMHITIHKGTDEIGGNCVEVSSKNTRILIDVGKPFSEKNYMLPDNLKSVDCVLISHAHQDHYGLIDQMPEDVPIYIGKLGEKFIQASRLFRGKKSSITNLETLIPGKLFK